MHFTDKRTVLDFQRRSRGVPVNSRICYFSFGRGIYDAIGDPHLRLIMGAQPTDNALLDLDEGVRGFHQEPGSAGLRGHFDCRGIGFGHDHCDGGTRPGHERAMPQPHRAD